MSYSTLEIIKSQNNFCDINNILIDIVRKVNIFMLEIYIKNNQKDV